MEQRNGFLVDSSRDGRYLHKMLELALASLGEICILDKDGRYLYVSEQYTKSMDIPDEIMGQPIMEYIDDSELPGVLKSGRPTIGAIYQRNNISFWLNRCPIVESGKIVGVVGQAVLTEDKDLAHLRQKLSAMTREMNYYRERFQINTTSKYSVDEIVAESESMRELKETLAVIARSRSTVLLTGETGTGKEVFANAIHHASPRKDRPFIKINCAAIPDNLLESELFGYESGAFTGALKGGKIGTFEAADGGTILLDEVNSLSLNMQSKLLRAIQEKEVVKIGSTKPTSIDVRFIFATNKDLHKMVKEGTFREDFYYRVNVINLEIPPLRKRPEDIPALVNHFIKKFNAEMDMSIRGITDEALLLLQSYDWPGNIRELENQIERAYNYAVLGPLLDINHFSIPVKDEVLAKVPLKLRDVRKKAEIEAILRAMTISKGNKNEAARILEIDRSQLYDKIKKYQLESPRKPMKEED